MNKYSQISSNSHYGWENIDWDFRGENTEYLTHGLHKYPGRMPPQIPRTLLKLFPNVSHVLDPFCGSGTTLVEAIHAGKCATGIDLNPLAVLISKVKTTPISPIKLRSAEKEVLSSITRSIHHVRTGLRKYPPSFDPNEVNLYYWFSRKSVDELGAISDYLLNRFDLIKTGEAIHNFFLTCFSNTVRKVSLQRPQEFKLFRVSNWENKRINVLEVFRDEISRGEKSVLRLTKAVAKNHANVIRDDFTKLKVKLDPADMVITSPPYGDSNTTLAYGQFSRYPLLWIGYDKEDVYAIDKRCFGGNPDRLKKSLPSPTLKKILDKIRMRSVKRANSVESFFDDLFAGLYNIHENLVLDSPACFVVGERKVMGIRIPIHTILAELGSEIGFDHFVTVERKISSKVLPNRNKSVDMICKEKLIVLIRS